MSLRESGSQIYGLLCCSLRPIGRSTVAQDIFRQSRPEYRAVPMLGKFFAHGDPILHRERMRLFPNERDTERCECDLLNM